MGLAVGLHSCEPFRLAEEINRLGVKKILLRVPLWEVNNLSNYKLFLEAIPDCDVSICVMQNREIVVKREIWRNQIYQVLNTFWPRVTEFQIGQGVNRSKWGFFNYDEYLRFSSEAEALRGHFKGIELIGPGILDFEPIALMRCLSHGYPVRWDVVGVGLYVDRRGSPRNRQLILFNLEQKILNFAAIARASTKASTRMWITEFNWGISGTGRYAPSSDKDCFSTQETAHFLHEYFIDAWATGFVERAYWWQLVSKGYGLLDVTKTGKLKPRPAYRVFKEFLENGIPEKF